MVSRDVSNLAFHLSDVEAQLVELIVDGQVETGAVPFVAPIATCILKAALPACGLLLAADNTLNVERGEHAFTVDAGRVLQG